ncbi:hypothetical protein [Roseomonas xinghualingensis]|uniref:hypothetical protein n=1 Tax=Roseomonas xinghualingensis TaxID=2986475 RepID=UPI0021F10F5B|nr:hypothetical protein [Roseomonas sp. SXEYE001]MCV4209237.1 hypothetical protein [Roseomonas sp. SXEYE001]
MRRMVFVLALALGGCVAPAVVPPVPPLAGAGPWAPGINAINGAAEAFGNPASLAGRPAEAAVAVIRLEWETEAVMADNTFDTFSTMTGPALLAARWQVRRALGIEEDAPPAVVIAGMEAAATALARGDRAAAAAALPPPVFAPGILTRLANMPSIPQANLATHRAQRDIEFGREEEWDVP